MQLEPAAFDGELNAGSKFGAAAAVLAHEGSIDQFDIDAAGHGRLDAGGDLDQLAGSGFRVCEGAFGRQFQAIVLQATYAMAGR